MNAPGRRANWGAFHHKARLSTAQVDEMRELHEQARMSYKKLAARFNVAKETVAAVCAYRRRCRG
jgi:DNA-binding transcriptional regulator YiaG